MNRRRGRTLQNARDWRDRMAAVSAWSSAALVSLGIFWLAATVSLAAVPVLSWQFLVAEPLDAGRAGGIGPVLVATTWLLIICVGVSLPIGVGTALFLVEWGNHHGRLGYVARWALDMASGVPSIIFGLFGNAFFCHFLGLGYSLLSGGLTLAIMVLPLLVRVAEQGLRHVPESQRWAAAALGLSHTTTLLTIVLPHAAPAIMAGLLLSMARALAETAALVFTCGYAMRMPHSLLDSGRVLSVHIYDLAMNVPGGEQHAAASALVLVGLLFAIHLCLQLLFGRWLTYASR